LLQAPLQKHVKVLLRRIWNLWNVKSDGAKSKGELHGYSDTSVNELPR